MHDAALGGNIAMVELLLSAGAELQAPEAASGATPLHVAAAWGRTGVVELLLEKGADPNLTNAQGQTPAAAAEANQQDEIAKLLRVRMGKD